MKRRLLAWAGPIIGAAGAAFVVVKLVENWPTVRSVLGSADLVYLVLALLVGGVAIALLGLVWRFCLLATGHRTGTLDSLHQYFVGQLGKYVPGGIWPVVGRAEMARRGGASRPTAYWATVLALSLTYLAAILVALFAVIGGAGRSAGLSWRPVLLLLPLGLLLVHPRILETAFRQLRRMTRTELDVRVPAWTVSVGLVLGYVPAWLGISAATWLVTLALSGQAPSVVDLTFATTLAWTVGFLAVPVPGGIGVREATFVAAFTSVPPGVAAAVAVVARFVFILADTLGAAITTFMTRRFEADRKAMKG